MSERATPFYCPYCGDEDLRPEEGEGGSHADGGPRAPGWVCGACRRVFAVTFVGLRLGEGAK
ncbi:MAG TPA: Insertion element protein [Amycolatopsis sp.]|jgi:hypothetical protein|nr:Insertion element protein [Amycolatopsis sp.]